MIVAVLAIVIAVHAGIFRVFSAVIDKEIPFMDRTAAQRVGNRIRELFVVAILYMYL